MTTDIVSASKCKNNVLSLSLSVHVSRSHVFNFLLLFVNVVSRRKRVQIAFAAHTKKRRQQRPQLQLFIDDDDDHHHHNGNNNTRRHGRHSAARPVAIGGGVRRVLLLGAGLAQDGRRRSSPRRHRGHHRAREHAQGLAEQRARHARLLLQLRSDRLAARLHRRVRGACRLATRLLRERCARAALRSRRRQLSTSTIALVPFCSVP